MFLRLLKVIIRLIYANSTLEAEFFFFFGVDPRPSLMKIIVGLNLECSHCVQARCGASQIKCKILLYS